MKKYQLGIPDGINNQIIKAHKQGRFSALRTTQFIRHLITLGLANYQSECRQEQRKNEAPEIRSIQLKIIPFPGVTLNQDDNFQNALGDFLKEMGYVE
jgi:hypothetical protein